MADITRHAAQSDIQLHINSEQNIPLPHSFKALSESPDPDELILVYPPGGPGAINIAKSDLNRLCPDEFLNDTVIEFGLKLYWNELRQKDPVLAESIHIFNSFFFKKLNRKNLEEGYQSVRRWTLKVDLFKKKYVIIPINENLHWYLAIISWPEYFLCPPSATSAAEKHPMSPATQDEARPRMPCQSKINDSPIQSIEEPEIISSQNEAKRTCIFTMDSLGLSHKPAIKTLRTYLVMEARDKLSITKVTDSICGQKASVPVQPNHCDCGIFLLHFAKTFMSDPVRYCETILRSSKQADWHQAEISRVRNHLTTQIVQLSEQWRLRMAVERQRKKEAAPIYEVESSDSEIEVSS